MKLAAADGTCWASPFLMPGKSHAVASKKDFGEAFSDVLVDCVLINGGLGGSGRDIGRHQSNARSLRRMANCRIGGDNNLVVFVGEFNPKEISCNHDSLPGSDFEASCQSILNSMPYDKVDRWFGGQVQGHVMLPKTFTSGELQYRMIALDSANQRSCNMTGYAI